MVIDQRLPEQGEELVFYDDGKRSRKYQATVFLVLPRLDSRKIRFEAWKNSYANYLSTRVPGFGKADHSISLYEIWRRHVREVSWIFANNTDYFIECVVPDFDPNALWFARTKTGGWYSMGIQNGWQGGLLEI